MNILPKLITLLSWPLAFPPQTHAGWEVSESRVLNSDNQPERVVLVWSPEEGRGQPALKAALQALATEDKVGHLQLLTVHRLVPNEAFQKEILQVLEVIVPKELKEAQKSAGNMHNPKMTALRQGFEKAVLTTPTVARFNEDLARHGLEIASVSFEKLSIDSSEGKKRFSCAMWLVVGKAANKAPKP